MRNWDCDLQLHGKFAGGVSKNMEIALMAEQARLKGLHVLVTADIQHAQWLEHVKKNITEEENGVFTDREKRIYFIVGTEVEDNQRLHHLIYLPDLTRATEFRAKIQKFGNLDCSLCGRPILRLSAEQIAEIVFDLGGTIGPAHSFTPYTGLFSKWNSVADAYQSQANKILFLELGLSADTRFADQIQSNHKYTFLSSSDAHSAWPHRMGREFNRIRMKTPSFQNLAKALGEREEKNIVLNAGLDPREGKYHETACNQCYSHYSIQNAIQFNWICPNCKGSIKKGVKDRIQELATLPFDQHPSFRPPYQHLLPLAEIIQQALGVENVLSKSVQSHWKNWIERFENEIAVLLDIPENEIVAFDPKIGAYINAFRHQWVEYCPGGGGQYGKPFVCLSREAFESKQHELREHASQKHPYQKQKTLSAYTNEKKE